MNSSRHFVRLVLGLVSFGISGCHVHLVLGPNDAPLDESTPIEPTRDSNEQIAKEESPPSPEVAMRTSRERTAGHRPGQPAGLNAGMPGSAGTRTSVRLASKRADSTRKSDTNRSKLSRNAKGQIQLTQYSTESDRAPGLLPATLIPGSQSANAPTTPIKNVDDDNGVKPAPAALENEAAESSDVEDDKPKDVPPLPDDSISTGVVLPEDDRHPLNLNSALQLAGANNLQIAMAAEHVRQAVARLDGAEVMWIPSLNVGVGYNAHIGRLQATDGSIVEVNRESLFAGGGPLLQGAPLTGGSGGPARFFVDISPADIYFEPLAAKQAQVSAQAAECVVFNDTLLNVAVAWLDLQQAQSQLAIADEAIAETRKLVELTADFAKSGAGLEADVRRAKADLAERQRQRLEALERVAVVSTNLARLLRLPPEVELYATGTQPVPLELIDGDTDLHTLVGQAASTRPELMRDTARVEEANHRARQERWRPWLPNLHIGMSSGVFGGGPGGRFDSFSDRTDFDALAVWKLQNFGFGNQALQDERASQHRAAFLAWEQTYDNVVAEVTRAWKQTRLRRKQVEQAAKAVKSAAAALELNFEGIRGRELRPIEAQQAITALANARREHLKAVVSYNQSQFALLRSVGETPK